MRRHFCQNKCIFKMLIRVPYSPNKLFRFVRHRFEEKSPKICYFGLSFLTNFCNNSKNSKNVVPRLTSLYVRRFIQSPEALQSAVPVTGMERGIIFSKTPAFYGGFCFKLKSFFFFHISHMWFQIKFYGLFLFIYFKLGTQYIVPSLWDNEVSFFYCCTSWELQ